MCKDTKKENDMDTQALTRNYTLNEDEALKILNSPIKKITRSSVVQDYRLSKIERTEQARSILDSWK